MPVVLGGAGREGFVRGTPPLEVHQWGQTLGAPAEVRKGLFYKASAGSVPKVRPQSSVPKGSFP